MCSDRDKRRGWRKGERKIEESEGGRGTEERHRIVLTNNCRKEKQEEGKHLCVTRSILISCFDFHKMSIILNHTGPPLLAPYA